MGQSTNAVRLGLWVFLCAGCAASDAADSSSSPNPAAAASPCALPACLSELFALCPPQGACGSSSAEGGVDHCYESGVTVRAMPSSAGASPGAYTVRKAGGEPCYSVEVQAEGNGLAYLYRTESEMLTARTPASSEAVWAITCQDGDEVTFDASMCSEPDPLLPPSRVSECSSAPRVCAVP